MAAARRRPSVYGGGAGRKSDLGQRTVSAIAMLAVAGFALLMGGWVWLLFVIAVALGTLFEWTRLFLAFAPSFGARLVWALGGAIYVGVGALTLLVLRSDGIDEALFPILLVIATDVGAYFAGRTFGGPKIAPRISPSKTWAGLGGGMLSAAVTAMVPALLFADYLSYALTELLLPLFAFGAISAVFAQAGDFFESWMKRRAGVKDSGGLLPGHGGLFDRIDGLLAVLFVSGVTLIVQHAMAVS